MRYTNFSARKKPKNKQNPEPVTSKYVHIPIKKPTFTLKKTLPPPEMRTKKAKQQINSREFHKLTRYNSNP